MLCHLLHKGQRIIVLLLLYLIAPNLTEGSENRETKSFAIKGAALGMGLEHALKIFPTAQIAPEAANCHNYGRAIRLPELTRRVLRVLDDDGDLTLNFDPPYAGGWLARIYYDQPVDPATFNMDNLLEELKERYGAYDRILYRRKMEPAGRIVGFEWRNTGGATLRVVLRNDYRNNGDNLHLSFLARSPAHRLHPVPHDLSYLCEAS